METTAETTANSALSAAVEAFWERSLQDTTLVGPSAATAHRGTPQLMPSLVG